MTSQTLSQVVQQAREAAKAILSTLEQTGHPQTNESSGVYLALVTLQKRLAAQGPGGRVEEFAPELEELAALCQGKLEPLKPLFEEAVRIARVRRP
ncbi:MAG TPA: hypothetical protein VEU74_11425 [Gemmatimonadales bacterium]|nr:hypothetical protein [Gemmatimonadales bacterium]